MSLNISSFFYFFRWGLPLVADTLSSAKNRRYIVDEEVGAVDVFNDFPFLDPKKPNGTSSTNLVRVEGGKIRYIHEVTICTQNNCGRG